MKKCITIFLIMMLLVLGASSLVTEKRNVHESSNQPIITIPANSTINKSNSLGDKESDGMNSNTNSISESELDSFIGEWNTTKRLVIPIVYSEEELKERDMVGHKIIIKADLFSDEDTQYKKPYYKVSTITDNEFVGENIGTFANSSLGELKIRNNSNIKKLDVYSDQSSEFLVETFYLEDENTLITNSNFIAFFELERIK